MKLVVYGGKWDTGPYHPVSSNRGEKISEISFRKYTDLADYLDTTSYNNNVMALFVGNGLPKSVVYNNGSTWIEGHGHV